MTIGQPPFRVWSIHFDHGGASSAIPLKDPSSGKFLGATPEWVAFPEGGGASRDEPAAYVAGSAPVVRVIFQLAGPSTVAVGRRSSDQPRRTVTIRADEVHGGIGVASRRHEITFDSTGMSPPLEFELTAPLPGDIGCSILTWHWIVEDELEGPATHTIGLTDHRIFTVLAPPLPPATWEPVSPDDPPVWAWLPVVEWTCDWAAGVRGDKAICDALIGNMHRSGLKYGVSAHLPLAMFTKGGGMCSGFYRLFQAMAGCHGVTVLRRAFLVNWTKGTDETRWCALVVTRPGLNRQRPAFSLSLFHDVDELPGAVHVQPRRVIERRYRFWGDPVQKTADGHCINFLECDEGKFLYDCCFLDHAVEVDVVPEVNVDTPTPVAALGNFKSAYLDGGVAYMLGSLDNGGTVFRTVLGGMYEGKRRWRDDGFDNQLDLLNGLTVRTEALAPDEIDFFWGP